MKEEESERAKEDNRRNSQRRWQLLGGKRKGQEGKFEGRLMVLWTRRRKHGPVSVDQVVCDALRDSDTHKHVHTYGP